MPFTVVTLSNCPAALRGDLTKWMQEISTGVYVGNFNSRIRDHLWERIQSLIGRGSATMSFSFQNEIGYDFRTFNTRREVTYVDGIPLVYIPSEDVLPSDTLNEGFSNAAIFHKVRNHSKKKSEEKEMFDKNFLALDLETTGLDEDLDNLIEIGAIKFIDRKSYEFQSLIRLPLGVKVPAGITRLTGITTEDLECNGRPIDDVLKEFVVFAENLPIVGYNISFDIRFLRKVFSRRNIEAPENSTVDLLKLVKKEKKFLVDYKFETALKAYEVSNSVPHRALLDAKLVSVLAGKVNNFYHFLR